MANILSNALNTIGFDHDPNELIGEILVSLNRELNASSSTFWRYDKMTGLLSLDITCVNEDGNLEIIRDVEEVGFPTLFSVKKYRTTRKLYFEGKPFVQVIDLADEDLKDHGEWLQSMGVKAVLQLPIIFQNDFVGWIPVHSNVSKNPWAAEDIKKAKDFANELAIGLRIKELTDQVKASAVLQERTNFAREIHDTLAQGFVGILLQLDVAEAFIGKDDARFRNHFNQARKLAELSLAEARKSIKSLRSVAEAGKNIITMLRKDVFKTYDNAPIFIEEKGDFPEIKPEAKYEVHRIICEALSNSMRHSQADEIKIVFSSSPDTKIDIIDNGIGMSQLTSGTQSYGLEIMHERAEKIGAQVEIASEPEYGTRVSLFIPRALVVNDR